MKKTILTYLFLLAVAGVIIFFDQWTKGLVRTQLAFEETWSPWPWLAPYARIIHWNNTGAAFGIFRGYNLVFSILAVIVSTAILIYFPRVPANEWWLRLALSMQLGGAVGNLIDRLTYGQVTDFISVGSFAVFNVADSSISIGVVVLLLGVWIKEQKDKKQKRAESPQNPLPPVEGEHSG